MPDDAEPDADGAVELEPFGMVFESMLSDEDASREPLYQPVPTLRDTDVIAVNHRAKRDAPQREYLHTHAHKRTHTHACTHSHHIHCMLLLGWFLVACYAYICCRVWAKGGGGRGDVLMNRGACLLLFEYSDLI